MRVDMAKKGHKHHEHNHDDTRMQDAALVVIGDVVADGAQLVTNAGRH